MRRVLIACVLGCAGSPALAQSSGLQPAASAAQAAQAAEARTTVPQGTAGVLAQQPPTTVPGVTVTGRKLKPCSPRDQACIDDISKEIWTRYPKQIETMCTHESIRVMQQGFQMEQLGMDTTQVNTRLTPETKTLCDYGAKMKMQAKAAAAAPPAAKSDDPGASPKP